MRAIGGFLLLALTACQTVESPQPIIDMHRHAPLASSFEPDGGPGSMATELREQSVVLSIVSVTSPAQAERWSDDTSDLFVLGAMMPCPKNLAERYDCFPETDGLPDLVWLRDSLESGRIGAFHELMFNYDGTPPDSAKMAPYWALAAEYGVPVGVHSWSGPPPGRSIRANPNCCPDYDGEMGNPNQLRAVLHRHPDLKIWLQHIGSDGFEAAELWDETLSLLSDYPNVYLDLSITNSLLPIEVYENSLVRLIEAGFEDRVMLGSDNVPIALILERLEEIEIISDRQRAAILYENAAEFLDLDADTRRKHRNQ
ncbi:MAG: amidohydrolase family protein [Hyphomonadaceae bacterium]|nr:amidohydrolase family protein [Hyphomonadaceae bacterium]